MKGHMNEFTRQLGTPAKGGLIRDPRGLLVHQNQSFFISDTTNQTIKTIPSLSVPVFGNQFEIDIKEVGYLENIDLNFVVSDISGVSNGTFSFVPSNLWTTRVEVISIGNGNTILTYYPEQQHIEPNLWADDDIERFYMNHATGNYADAAERQFLAGKQSLYISNLWGLLRQTLIPIPEARHGIKLRIYMKPLAHIVELGVGASGTPAASIISCSALCLYSAMSNPTEFSYSLVSRPRDFKILDFQYMNDVIPSGQSSKRLTLSSINGYVSYLWFIVRGAQPTGSDLLDLVEVKDYAILDSGGNNVVGGNVITDTISRTIYGRMYCHTKYLPETGIHVYVYSFSPDPKRAVSTGNELGGRVFQGTEQLLLNFSTALVGNHQVDIYAATYSALRLGPDGLRKVGI